MRFPPALAGGLAAAGLVALAGCGSSGPAAAPAASATTRPTAAQTGPVVPNAQAGARAAAGRFDTLDQSGRFAASWGLLVPAVQVQIPVGTWVKVHDACRPGSAAGSRAITSITVFGNAAIVTEASAARPAGGHAEEVFSYADGRWGYSPNDLGIYRHGSPHADVAAARAAGVCATWKSF
jgi:predicted small lipoprotein YifL